MLKYIEKMSVSMKAVKAVPMTDFVALFGLELYSDQMFYKFRLHKGFNHKTFGFTKLMLEEITYVLYFIFTLQNHILTK